jgi:hypothetical protein
MREQTISSLRNPGHLMRAGMNKLTTQVNSLRDYCGVITGHPLAAHYFVQQQQQEQLHDLRYSPVPISHLRPYHISTIAEEDEMNTESASLMGVIDQTPYAGFTGSRVLADASGIGRLDAANNSALFALNNFNRPPTNQPIEIHEAVAHGQMSAGIGLFHGHTIEQDDDLIDERARLTIYGEQRPAS